MVTLDELLDRGDERRDRTAEAGRQIAGYARVGIWGIGWLLAKAVLVLLGAVAAVFYGLGWVCARTLPVLKWARTAFMLGWEAGRAPTRRAG